MIKRMISALTAIILLLPFAIQNYPISSAMEDDVEEENFIIDADRGGVIADYDMKEGWYGYEEEYYYYVGNYKKIDEEYIDYDGNYYYFYGYDLMDSAIEIDDIDDSMIADDKDKYEIKEGYGFEYVVVTPWREKPYIQIRDILSDDIKDVVIPEEIDGIEVASLSYDFCSDSSVKSVALPDSIKRLCCVFNNCPELEQVKLPSNLKLLGESFCNCPKLKEISLPEKLVVIDKWCFESCGFSSITIPDSVVSIGDDFCSGCSELEEIIIGSKVRYIGACAFSKSKITSVDIPASVAYLCDGGYSREAAAFTRCEYLTDVNIADDNEILYDMDGVPFIKESNNLLFIPYGRSGDFVLPDGDYSIKDYYEYDRKYFIVGGKIESITFPDSFDEYDRVDISACRSVTELKVNDTNEKYKSVDGCIYTRDGKKLVLVPSSISGDFYVPETVESIGRAFQDVTLDKLVIPSKVKELTDFSITGKVKELIINSDEISLSFGDEWNKVDIECSELLLPGNCTFYGAGLENVRKLIFGAGKHVKLTVPECVTEVVFSPDIDELELYGEDKINIKELVLPKGNTIIGKKAFWRCNSLESVFVNGSIEIGERAFGGCNNLKSFIVNDTSKIGEYAFAKDKALDEVVMKQRSEISEHAFEDCTSLTNIDISLDSELNGESFINCPLLMKINGIEAVGEESTEFAPELDEFIRRNFYQAKEVGLIDRWLINKVKQVVSEVTNENMSEIEKVRALHDWICDNTVYDNNDDKYPENHIDSSVFMDGIAVCEGYTNTYNLLLNEVGIETCHVKTLNHSWNIVKVGGKYFHIDTTWDDSMQTDQWFMLSDAQILEPDGTHCDWKVSPGTYLHCFQKNELPVCNNVMGDMDGDGTVTLKDMIKLRSRIASGEAYTVEGDMDYNGRLTAADISEGLGKLSIIMGDINGDGTVDAGDASAILKEYAALSIGVDSTFTQQQTIAADMNADGKIDSSDASLILMYYSAISTGERVGITEFL